MKWYIFEVLKFLVYTQLFVSDCLVHSGSVPELVKGRALMLQSVV